MECVQGTSCPELARQGYGEAVELSSLGSLWPC